MFQTPVLFGQAHGAVAVAAGQQVPGNVIDQQRLQPQGVVALQWKRTGASAPLLRLYGTAYIEVVDAASPDDPSIVWSLLREDTLTDLSGHLDISSPPLRWLRFVLVGGGAEDAVNVRACWP